MKFLIEIIFSFLSKFGKEAEVVSKLDSMQDNKVIDWNNNKSKLTSNFTVGEATYLPSWGVYHYPSEEEKSNLLKVFEKMELIREYLNIPIRVHVAIRPTLNNATSDKHGKDYNQFIGGAKNSAHKIGLAVDFSPIGNLSCEEARKKLLPKLEEFEIRMEDITGNWVHIDCREPGPGGRFFKP